jgi:glycosyltransferase involved in cell wall biosynthesis
MTKEKPTLFVILSRFPFPLEKGDKLRAYHQIKEFSRSFKIQLCCITDKIPSKDQLDELRPYCVDIHLFKQPKWVSYFQTFVGLFRSKPLQVSYFHSYMFQRRIHALLNKIKPHHVYCQLIRAAEYVKDYHECPKTIDYMDALSMGIERRIGLSPWYTKWAFKLEARRLKEYESKIFNYFEFHTIISEQDRNYIAHPDKAKIICIPNGVGENFFDFQLTKQPDHDLVFVGNLSYAPNVEAVKYLTEKILPKLPISSNKILISGAQPSHVVNSMCHGHANITLRSWVDDIRDSYVSGRVFVAPMFIGTGLQNKLLEAMALGIPCVTTSLANNALKAKENEEILIANTTEEFIEALEQLKNEEFCQNIRQNAQKFVKANFRWNQSTAGITKEMFKR